MQVKVICQSFICIFLDYLGLICNICLFRLHILDMINYYVFHPIIIKHKKKPQIGGENPAFPIKSNAAFNKHEVLLVHVSHSFC